VGYQKLNKLKFYKKLNPLPGLLPCTGGGEVGDEGEVSIKFYNI